MAALDQGYEHSWTSATPIVATLADGTVCQPEV